MTFYIQHGYGKAQKLNELFQTGRVAGLILSPADEDAAVLRDTAAWARERELAVLVDPQTYLYSTQPSGRGRNHLSHGLVFEGLSWAQDAQSIAKHVQQIGAINNTLNPNGLWIAPGPLQDTFADVWTPLSVQFARTAGQDWGEQRTLATVAIEEGALADWSAIERWLDVVTALPIAGFYLVISRGSSTYPPAPWQPARLANLLRLIHILGESNAFEVVVGYSDLEGLLALSVGAASIGAGWSYTLRQFSSSKWLNPATGGRAATVRTPVDRLLALPKAEAETAPLFASDLRDVLFTVDEIRAYGSKPFAAIGRVEAQVAHLSALAKQVIRLEMEQGRGARLDLMERHLASGAALWDEVERVGLLADPSYKSRVESLLQGLRLFRERAGV